MSDSPARRTGDLQFLKQDIDVRTALEVERLVGHLTSPSPGLLTIELTYNNSS